ncbi:hypothetical protein FRX31_015353 [Thalictrum thalictroides]|uniref:Defensin-like protein n=1 Tax=Thalictrum thalictroides TaxID=46969 RepID=A0A7J6WCF4_THATH|nr:hypothetical protein FRX31_015353 [Thalictrum thalictroides]
MDKVSSKMIFLMAIMLVVTAGLPSKKVLVKAAGLGEMCNVNQECDSCGGSVDNGNFNKCSSVCLENTCQCLCEKKPVMTEEPQVHPTAFEPCVTREECLLTPCNDIPGCVGFCDNGVCRCNCTDENQL